MVKTVFESNVSLRKYCEKTKEIRVDANLQACVSICQSMSALVSCNIQIVERLLRSNELVLIHPSTNFYATSRPKLFYAAWSRFSCIRLTGSSCVRELSWPEWVDWVALVECLGSPTCAQVEVVGCWPGLPITICSPRLPIYQPYIYI